MLGKHPTDRRPHSFSAAMDTETGKSGTLLRVADNAGKRPVTVQACFGVQIYQVSIPR